MKCPCMLNVWLLALAAFGWLPAAQAADDATSAGGITDRLIVKYRDVPAHTRPDARAISRALTVAARHRMSLRPVLDAAAGAHVLVLDRCVPIQQALALAGELASGDLQVEFARPVPAGQPAGEGAADSSCMATSGSRYAIVR